MCSAELLGHKFVVPCDPVSYLNQNYGKKWNLPEADFKKYKWPNIKYAGVWSDNDYQNSINIFKSDGSFDRNYTLDFLNKRLHKKITIKNFRNKTIFD